MPNIGADIGSFNQLVTLQKGTETSNGKLGKTVTWADYASFWAYVEPASGREATMASQMTAVLSTVVTTWFRTDVSVKDRLSLGGRSLQIQSVQDPTARREVMRLLCSEVTA